MCARALGGGAKVALRVMNPSLGCVRMPERKLAARAGEKVWTWVVGEH